MSPCTTARRIRAERRVGPPPVPVLAVAIVVAAAGTARSQAPQNPSPMVEHTREHPRLEKVVHGGVRHELSIGTLFIPEGLEAADGNPAVKTRLLVHFHGAAWVAETAALADGSACLAIQLGSGSGAYAKPFRDREAGRFRALLAEAAEHAGLEFGPVTLSGWSAGCRAIREILGDPANDRHVDRVILIDGIHASYRGGVPGPLESDLVTEPLAPLVRFARLAMEGKKSMLVTHTEIFPGTFASTTETADWLLREIGVPRKAVLEWGPMKTQQLSEARRGGFVLLGFAGNSAPDHIDQLHALPEWLRRPVP